VNIQSTFSQYLVKKTTLGLVFDGEKTPRWAARGIDPPQPS
jgi:hypothetical protein